eukprot:g8486.t1
MKEQSQFKLEHSLEKRKLESEKLQKNHKTRVPVIVEKSVKCSLPAINKKKYLVPGDLTVGQFVYVIRQRIQLDPTQTLVLFVGELIPANGDLMMSVFEKHKDEDGFLYVTYATEKALGE